MSSLAAIALCAGQGTRMKSKKAKVLHRILGRPLCAYPVSRAFEAGASPVVAVVGHQADEVKQALTQSFPGRALQFAHQTQQRGTADAVRSAQAELQGHQGAILIVYGDTPLLKRETLEGLFEAYRSSNAQLALVTTQMANPHGYGRIVRENNAVKRVVEQKDCTPEQARITECNAGIYIADAQFLWTALAQIGSANAQGEFYLTDLVEAAARVGTVVARTVDAVETAGVNDLAELAACAKMLQQRINLGHMQAGVTFLDPSTAFVADDVVIKPDAEIGPMVTLHSGCEIDSDVSIGQGCVLSNTRVGARTEIKPYCVLSDSDVGQNCRIGPFAHLRPDSRLADDVHIGNFVETKKTVIARGSKANHLSYLGDADIGSGVNIGAGTITCNYDGKNKLKTTIQDNVFIGSDTQLVAPVTVGTGAYVGAGSTITKDVPPMSLAISRARQTVVEGWVNKKRK